MQPKNLPSAWQRIFDSVFLPALFLCCAFLCPVHAQVSSRPDADPRILKIINAISEDRLRFIDEKLVSFGTRHTLSSTNSSSRGIGAARQWIFDEFKQMNPKLQVSFDTYNLAAQSRIVREVELRNVMALLPGKNARRIYVSGHYDSLNLGAGGQIASNAKPSAQPADSDPQLRPNQNFDVDAPGANDDGSGVALTMELARVLSESGIEFDATLVFVCWAGEEQGLFGSRAHVQKIAAQGIPVEANFNSDIIGNSHGGNGSIDAESVRVYSDGPEDSMSRSLARYVQNVAAIYVPGHRIRLMARQDRFSRGSDHSSFSQRGYPAIVFREAKENFANQHSAKDTLDGVDFHYLLQTVKVNAAAVAALAMAPSAPKVRDAANKPMIGRQPTGYNASLRWNPVPGAAAYRIYWRDTWSNEWQHQQQVGNVTEFIFPNLCIDDFVFGVAALDNEGHESLISAYVATPRPSEEVKLLK